MAVDTLAILKRTHLLRALPDEQLALLGGKLKAVTLADGSVLFEEGSQGRGMYFVANGEIRISKRASGETFKDLAILGPGDYFGEMELIGSAKRSARASALGPAVVLELDRDEMNSWLKSHPDLAISVFNELARVQSDRLRRTSNELTLLFDLANLLLERNDSAKALLTKVLDHVVPHLEGIWSGEACLYNQFNDEVERLACHGAIEEAALAGKLPKPTEKCDLWLDRRTHYATLPGPGRPLGYLLFQSAAPLGEEERANTSRILVTVTRFLTAAIQNINFQAEEAMRARLKVQSYGSRF